MNKIDMIVNESIKKVLNEADIFPNNGMVRNRFVNQWRMIYNLLANIKGSMDATNRDNGGRITKHHVDNISICH